MSKYIVPTKRAGDPTGKGLFQSIETALEAIRRRAYELFRSRGGAVENDLDDWFRAERELFEVPPSALSETDDAFVVTVAAPAFEAEQLQVAVDAGSVTIRGEAETKREKTHEKQIYSELTRKELFRRFSLPGEVDAGKARANFTDGYLKIVLPKIAKADSFTIETLVAA